MDEDWSEREIDEGREPVSREIDRLKRVYRDHAGALSQLAMSAPTKALARKYSDLIGDINRSIIALDDPGAMVSRSTAERPIERGPDPRATPALPPSPRLSSASVSDVRLRTEPGRVPLEPEPSAFGRIALILGMAIIVISLLAFFVWKFGGEPRSEDGNPPPAAARATAEAPPVPPLSARPEAQDFGVVYKGTRAAKTFQVHNNTDGDMTIELERSRCQCLWFDYPKRIPAGESISISIAVDGDRAPSGLVSEAVVIVSTQPPRFATEIQITAEIR